MREIVVAHGGEVTAASPPDRGAIFTVRLPLRASAGAQAGDSPPEAATESMEVVPVTDRQEG